MNREELFRAFRARVADTATPPLWTDAELAEFLDDAHNEAADRARLIRDSTTPEVCAVDVVPGTASYQLHQSILSVERAKLDLKSTPLTLTSTAAMDGQRNTMPREWRTHSLLWVDTGGGWETQTGTPFFAVLDDEAGRWKLTLAPIPVVADTLRLQVFRLPLHCLDDSEECPEINPRLHIRLVDWMEHRAYGKKDADTFDDKRSMAALAVFTSAFGERVDANVRRKQEDLTPSVVQFREF